MVHGQAMVVHGDYHETMHANNMWQNKLNDVHRRPDWTEKLGLQMYVRIQLVKAIVIVLKTGLFPEYETFYFRPRVFSRALGCGARRGPTCTRCKCGSRPGSVARALDLQSREIWQLTRGSLSDELDDQAHRNVQNVISCLLVLRSAAVYQYLLQVPHQPSHAIYFDLTQPRYNSSIRIPGSSSSFSLCDRLNHASACVCVSSKDLTASSRNYQHKMRG